jgi:hypothetical protein
MSLHSWHIVGGSLIKELNSLQQANATVPQQGDDMQEGGNSPDTENKAITLDMSRYEQTIVDETGGRLRHYLEPLKKLDSCLVHLCIHEMSNFDRRDLLSLADLPQLVFLEIAQRHVPESNFIDDFLIQAWGHSAASNGGFPALRMLRIHQCQLTIHALEDLRRFPVLDVVDIAGNFCDTKFGRSPVPGWIKQRPRDTLLMTYLETFLDQNLEGVDMMVILRYMDWLYLHGKLPLAGIPGSARPIPEKLFIQSDFDKHQIHLQYRDEFKKFIEDWTRKFRPPGPLDIYYRDEDDSENGEDDPGNINRSAGYSRTIGEQAFMRTLGKDHWDPDRETLLYYRIDPFEVFWLLGLLDYYKPSEGTSRMQFELGALAVPRHRYVYLELIPQGLYPSMFWKFSQDRSIYRRSREDDAKSSESESTAASSAQQQTHPTTADQDQQPQHHIGPAPSWAPRADDRKVSNLTASTTRNKRKGTVGDLLSSFGTPGVSSKKKK